MCRNSIFFYMRSVDSVTTGMHCETKSLCHIYIKVISDALTLDIDFDKYTSIEVS